MNRDRLWTIRNKPWVIEQYVWNSEKKKGEFEKVTSKGSAPYIIRFLNKEEARRFNRNKPHHDVRIMINEVTGERIKL